jgi:hypothetical protein
MPPKQVMAADLAKRLRIGPEQLDSWISGERHVPNTKILALIDLLDRLGALGDEA